MANYSLTSSENSNQLWEKSDTLEKKLGLHSFKYKVSASHIWSLQLLQDKFLEDV